MQIRQIPLPIIKAAEELKAIAQAHRRCQVGVTINEDYSLRPYNMNTTAKDGISEFHTEHESGIGATNLTARPNKVYGEVTRYRIRKLTPRECFRLMGVADKDIDKMQAHRIKDVLKNGEVKEKPIPKTQLYKMAGNSIVVDVLEKIFENLFIPEDNRKG